MNYWERVEETFEVMKAVIGETKRPVPIKKVIEEMKKEGFTEEEILECINHKWDEGKVDLIMGDYKTGNYRIGRNLYHYVKVMEK